MRSIRTTTVVDGLKEPNTFEAEFIMRHYTGGIHAVFLNANAAKKQFEALRDDPDPRVQTWFYFEDMNGKKVERFDEVYRGHAYAIMETLARHDAAKKAKS
jgi:hypothetical protein